MLAQLLGRIPDVIEMVSLLLTALTILATVIARLTKTTKDDEFVSKWGSMLLKGIHFLPTIGVNPNTKKLESAYLELREKYAERTGDIVIPSKEELAAEHESKEDDGKDS